MGTRRKRRAVVNGDICVACGCCARVCPLSAIQIWHGVRAEVNGERCVGCGKCAKAWAGTAETLSHSKPI